MTTSTFPTLLQLFFTDRLNGQLGASPHTIASYRDTFRLLLRFAAEHLGRPPTQLHVEDLNTPFLAQFLDHIEADRGNSVRTRNIRLAALHSFFRYVAFAEPAHALQCQRVLAIPPKRCEHGTVEFLSQEEAVALVGTPDTRGWIGRRDHVLLVVALQTGLRNSEIRALRRLDVGLGTGAHVRCLGKGRKMRCTPLRPDVAHELETWLSEEQGGAEDHVFPSSRGGILSPDALQRLVKRHAAAAAMVCPSIAGKRVTPHTLRHTAAMSLLHAGIDLAVIALWLGHESNETTEMYLHADMRLKERALAHTGPTGVALARFEATDSLLAFLESI